VWSSPECALADDQIALGAVKLGLFCAFGVGGRDYALGQFASDYDRYLRGCGVLTYAAFPLFALAVIALAGPLEFGPADLTPGSVQA